MEYLLASDRALFLVINGIFHHQILDTIALAISGIGSSGIIWFLLSGLLFYREEKKHPLFFVPVMSTGIVSYVMVELVWKPWFQRIRPTIDMGAIIVGDMKTDFSFPSGHATIAWAMAVVLSHYEPRWKWWFYGLAVCISLSRIYLGVHYPLDVLCGAILGIIIAWLHLTLGSYVRQRWIPSLPDLSKKIR